MNDVPIIFSAPMVLALLAGRKTQTRRLAWAEKPPAVINGRKMTGYRRSSPWQKVKPGDRLWVRENFALVGGGDPGIPIYAANWQDDAEARGFDNIPVKPPKWTPCIHMPRWASRLALTITATKVEPLQDISDDDAVAEGLWYCEEGDAAGFWFASPEATESGVYGEGAADCYMRLWDHLHGPGAWEANPEVVALTFEIHNANIDALKAPALDKAQAVKSVNMAPAASQIGERNSG